MLFEEIANHLRTTVSYPKPHDLGRRSSEDGALIEIRVLRYANEVIVLSVIPDLVVSGSLQAAIPDMRAFGEEP